MMTRRPATTAQFDFFVPVLSDLALRDQRETMERPFFSLAKRKRLKPIEYISPKGDVFVNVYPNPEFGMATIWDADVLIWAASALNSLKRTGVNDLPRTLHFQPFDLLRAIRRDTGGRDYRLLREGLGRLQATTIVTNIRVRRGKKQRQFSWIESWTDIIDDDTQLSRGMSITLSEWFYEGVVMDGGVLSIDPAYFAITSGRERWLYRVARKHAGGAGAGGFAIALPTLFEKSGAEGTYRRFKFEMQNLARRDGLPGFELSIEGGTGGSEPTLRMMRRGPPCEDDLSSLAEPSPEAALLAVNRTPTLPLFERTLDAYTIERVRADCPGWDIYAIKAEFDAWLHERPDRTPQDYQAAFHGFAVRFHAAQR